MYACYGGTPGLMVPIEMRGSSGKNKTPIPILFFNTDKRSKSLKDMLDHAEDTKTLIIGLAETTAKLNTERIKSYNFEIYQTPGTNGECLTTILIHNSIVANIDPGKHWGHAFGRASAVTLNTIRGKARRVGVTVKSLY